MSELNSRQEAFCLAYAEQPNGAAAARRAGYSSHSAAQAANELLRRPAVNGRIAELQADHNSARTAMIGRLIDKLEPVYETSLDAGDTEAVLLIVELQARIAGFIQGASGFRLRPASRADTPSSSVMSQEDALAALA